MIEVSALAGVSLNVEVLLRLVVDNANALEITRMVSNPFCTTPVLSMRISSAIYCRNELIDNTSVAVLDHSYASPD
jgi:hypothetical protein